MCGRFGLYPELDSLAEQFNFDPAIMRDIYQPRWNIPPTTPVLAVSRPAGASHAKNTATLMRWGLTASGGRTQAKSTRPLFNARAETVHRLPSFRQSFREQRCLIPASGFYEWQRDAAGGKAPVWFYRQDSTPFAFAGIWTDDNTQYNDLPSCAVITCAANDFVKPVHTRMPVILPSEAQWQWLNPRTSESKLRDLLQPVDWHDMTQHRVSRDVNRAGNDYPSLVDCAVEEIQSSLTGVSQEQ